MLPEGVRVIDLSPNVDGRGAFTEIFRSEWKTGVLPIQLNAVSSLAGTLRGVHVHPVHNDYLTVISGEAVIGLCDLREGSSTKGMSALVPMTTDFPVGLVIPKGVAHGFYFTKPSIHFYAVDRYFDPADELGCAWDDPALEIAWPGKPEHLSARDLHAPPLSKLLEDLKPWQPFLPERA